MAVSAADAVCQTFSAEYQTVGVRCLSAAAECLRSAHKQHTISQSAISQFSPPSSIHRSVVVNYRIRIVAAAAVAAERTLTSGYVFSPSALPLPLLSPHQHNNTAIRLQSTPSIGFQKQNRNNALFELFRHFYVTPTKTLTPFSSCNFCINGERFFEKSLR